MPDLDKFLKSPEELEKVAITDRYRAMTHLSGATPPSLPALQFETPKRWFDRLPSLSINYSRVRDEAEPRTRAWRWGGLEIERIDDWGCAWLLLLYIVLGVALGGSCYLLSTPQEHKAVGVMATQISPITATFK